MSSIQSRRISLQIIATCLLAISCSVASAGRPNFLQKIFKRSNGAPEPAKQLVKEDGPWLILAHTFVGSNSKTRAEQLASEIKQQLRLTAFVYNEKFDFTQNPGVTTAPNRRARYANEYSYEAHAVLVGEYDSVNHPSIDRDLKRLKSADLAVFRQANIAQETNAKTPVTTVKAMHKKLLERVGGTTKKGPMANAFVTRNPMLPKDFFSAPEVDSFVKQLNEDKKFNLLECDGKYTVVVRTFEGQRALVDGNNGKKFIPNMRRLDRYAADAAKMVTALRKDGEEAYQYHDRHRSLVTIGSFDSLGHELPNGGYQYEPAIMRVMEKYSALNRNRASMMPNSNGVAAHHVAMIPFDVQPKPIAVPKITRKSLYSALRR